jgi:hypothetical protein
LGQWAVAAISIPLFAATAQNLTYRDAKVPLLKRYKGLDYADPFGQRLHRFTGHCTHSAAVGAGVKLHRA